MQFPELPSTDPLLEPGLYDGDSSPWIPPEAYHASARLSRSQLVRLHHDSGTPAHFRWFLEHPPKPTAAMILGDAIHPAILEPERFERCYALEPVRWHHGRNPDKDEYAAWLADNPGRTVVRYDDAEILGHIARHAREDENVRKILSGGGRTECSVAWSLDRGKRGCANLRARLDREYTSAELGPVVVDLKSAKTASPRAWRNEIANRKLHVQAAFYLDGIAAVTGTPHNLFVHVIYETEPPYLCAVRWMDREDVEIGRREYIMAIDKYLECAAKNEWPGYGMEPTGLPPWYPKMGW